ncbi:MAG: PQQ-like beta-propeller repeat protein [Candidatus Aminicenantes bacterium]|nr:MAG: PQQ-like beta-propeller repeat protein [Candidatus Aminicenantes bacterium]
MKRKIAAIIVLLYFTSFLSLNAQWARTYGGSEDDFAYSIQQTTDGGYIVAGKTKSFSDESDEGDIWILKLASDGTVEWQKEYGKYYRYSDDEVYSIQQTTDGGFIVGGYYSSLNDIWIFKLSSGGDIEWQKAYESRGREIQSIRQTTDGGYIVACGEVSYYYIGIDYENNVLKLASDGTIVWQKSYGDLWSERSRSIQPTSDGGYVLAGRTESYGVGNGDVWVIKLASDGTVEWQKTYGGSRDEEGLSVKQTTDGGYVVAGTSSSFGVGYTDIWVFKLASDGSVEWQKTYGGSQDEEAYSIGPTSDGGYIVAGQTESFGVEETDIWVFKLASDGTVEWQKTYGGSQDEEAYSIRQTTDGGYILAGSTDTYGAGKHDIFILKLSPNGDIEPGCYLVNESNAAVIDTGISPMDTDVIPEDADFTFQATDAIPEDSEALVYSLCFGLRTLYISSTSGGTTDPPPGTYVYEQATRIALRAYPEDGFNLDVWSGDASGRYNPINITMDSDKSVLANFTPYPVEWETVKKTPCFIATAAYESPHHPHVRILQDFRDKYLMTSTFGLELVNVYYKYSPFVADLIETNKGLKVAVRMNLLPLVAVCFSMVNFGPTITGIMLFVFLVFPTLFVWLFRRKTSRKKDSKR